MNCAALDICEAGFLCRGFMVTRCLDFYDPLTWPMMMRELKLP